MSPARKSPKRSGAGARKAPKPAASGARWLILPVGLLIAALAGYALLAGDAPSELEESVGSRLPTPPVASPPHVHRDPAPTEHQDYDAQSREQLREILRQADEGEQ